MKCPLAILALGLCLVGCGKAKPTPDAAANRLFVEAVQLIDSAEEQTGEPAIKDYEQALAHLQKIISDYNESDLAVKLISGETLFTGKSLKEIKERVKELKRVVLKTPSPTPPVKSLEQRLVDGELAEADRAQLARTSTLCFHDLHPQITDAGLKVAAKLKQLEELWLDEAQVTIAGLKEFDGEE